MWLYNEQNLVFELCNQHS